MPERIYRPASSCDDWMRVSVPSITVFSVEPENYFPDYMTPAATD